jgi:hypothetical protein
VAVAERLWGVDPVADEWMEALIVSTQARNVSASSRGALDGTTTTQPGSRTTLAISFRSLIATCTVFNHELSAASPF